MKEIAKIKSLLKLDLSETQVTDLGLRELAGLKKLQSLKLLDTKVNDTGLSELRKTLPNCKISYR
jgi:hypothetical protein